MNRILVLTVAAATAALGLFARPALGVDVAETRGDFYFDRDGKLVGHRQAELPEGFDRRPMSHREKFELMGLELPQQRGALQPRLVSPKPLEVDVHDGVNREIVIVKFRDDAPVRLRSGRLTGLSRATSATHAILDRFPDASLERAFRTEERILEENRETGQILSGKELADLNNYYLIRVPAGSDDGIAIANELLVLDEVEDAYLQLRGGLPCTDVAPATGSWESSQYYRDPAPTGIDADFAWAYHSGGRGPGSSSYWVMDLEWEWCTSHEDLDFAVTDVVNGSTGSNPASMNHGTAVLGVVGACDNGFGAAGLSPNVNLKAADFDSEPSYASNVTTADSFLISGEIMILEIQLFGPTPPDPCVCNCSQYGGAPLELDGASYSAIETAVANGVIVVEAAGNGSMDLDDTSLYGNIFQRWFRDSGAIFVGASDAAHNPTCWTTFGSRVDVHGFGNFDIVTTGYGDLWSGDATCGQDYTAGFAGTSSASPIIAGACASLQGIAKNKYAYTLSPAQMRTMIQAGTTPQAASSKNIGPLPNLAEAVHEVEPDLIPGLAAGWDFSVVPRILTNSTFGDVQVPTGALAGNINATYWNATIHNQGTLTSTVNDPDFRVYVNDIAHIDAFSPNLGPGGWAWLGNFGPTTIKGGRHTVSSLMDHTFVEEESSETNNRFNRQFIWAPYSLTPDVPVSRTGDPYALSAGWGPYYNAEGFSASTSSSYWYAFAVTPTLAGDDFDIRLNTETPGNVPQAGFGANVAWASAPDGETAYVVLDRNTVASGTYWASVLNFNSGPAGNRMVEFDEDQGIVGIGSHGPFSLEANEVLNLHEVSLAAGTNYRIHVEVLSGSSDVALSLFGGSATGYYASNLPTASADESSGFADEFVVYSPASSGFHGVVVNKPGSASLSGTVQYNLHVNLDPNLVGHTPPSGWSHPLVPRNAPDGTTTNAVLSPTLPGDVAGTWLNTSTHNEGAGVATSPWQTRVYLDDQTLVTYGGPSLGSGTWMVANNLGMTVRGGRHHLRSFADLNSELTEFSETDNEFTDWFVWEPTLLANDTPVTRAMPNEKEPQGWGPWFGCDGLRAAPGAGMFWTGVAVMPTNAGDDVDVRIHTASTGSKDGFGSYPVWSGDGLGDVDFVVVNHNVVPSAAHDYGLLEMQGSGDYVAEQADAPYLTSVPAGLATFGSYDLAGGEIWDTYEIWVPAGTGPVWLSLANDAGNADLGLGVYEAATGYEAKLGAAHLADAAGAGGDEHLEGVALAEGQYHLIAVFKSRSQDLPLAAEYRLIFGTQSPTDAPQVAAAPTRFALAAPTPNPSRDASTVRFDVPNAGGSISIDVFDLTGRRITNLVNGVQPAGRHAVAWDGRDQAGRRVGSGVYFIRMLTAEGAETRKVTRVQ